MGRWKWDLALYMALAEIKVFRNGKLAGEAIYDSRSGSGSFKKYIKGGRKNILVGQLTLPKSDRKMSTENSHK